VCVFVCTECPRGRWGVGCQQVCQCHHSSGCDPVSGECLCLPGWFGRTCSQGIYTQHADRLTDSFYRAMPCIRGTSHGPVSVRLCLCLSVSVTSRSCTKTAKRRITKTTPHDSPGTLVFGCQRSPRISTGITPCGGAKYRWGGSKLATFANRWLYLENGTR